MEKGVLPPILLCLLMAHAAGAATIAGSLYDLSLDPLEKVVVVINTTPEQTYVAQDGIYAFETGQGTYLLRAWHEEQGERLETEELVQVEDESRYLIDLILFPVVQEGEDLSGLDVDEVSFGKSIPYFTWLIGGLAVLIMVLLLLFFFLRREDPAEHLDDEQLGMMLQYIKDQGGRVTQKELRKEFPLSEAKVSLMVSELEHKGHIEKIKQGKGNILILKR